MIYNWYLFIDKILSCSFKNELLFDLGREKKEYFSVTVPWKSRYMEYWRIAPMLKADYVDSQASILILFKIIRLNTFF